MFFIFSLFFFGGGRGKSYFSLENRPQITPEELAVP